MNQLKNALARRADMNLGETDAFRIIDGAEDEFPGITVDTFAGHWLISAAGKGRQVAALLEAAHGGAIPTPPKSIWFKTLDRQEKRPPVCLAGETLGGPFLIKEHGLRFEIDFAAGYSQGIFLDQRDNRWRVRQRVAPGQRVLNCFSYTCGFSVAASAGGAITTSLDLSGHYLEWGKRNFLANGVDPACHFFCRGDTLEWLRRFAKQGRTFHGIILDPPTFSRGPRGVFRIEDQFGLLLTTARRVLEPEGWLLCCGNDRQWTHQSFQQTIQQACPDRWEASAMPPDFRGEDYLKSVWISGCKASAAPY